MTIQELQQARETVAQAMPILNAFRGADQALEQAIRTLEDLEHEVTARRAGLTAELVAARRDAQDGLDRLEAQAAEKREGLARIDGEAARRRDEFQTETREIQRQTDVAQATLDTLEQALAIRHATQAALEATLTQLTKAETQAAADHAAHMADFATAERAAQARLDALHQALEDAVAGALGRTPGG